MQDNMTSAGSSGRTTDHSSHAVEILVATAAVLVVALSVYLTFFDGKIFY